MIDGIPGIYENKGAAHYAMYSILYLNKLKEKYIELYEKSCTWAGNAC